MASTPFLLEVLVVGIQLSVTIALWLVTVFGHKWIPWDTLVQWKSEVGLCTLVMAYLLGLIYDYLNPTHFSTTENDEPPIPEKVAWIHAVKPEVWKFLNDLSNRLKIARLSMWIWWFLFSGLIACYIRIFTPVPTIILAMIVSGGTISIMALRSWKKRREGYILAVRRRYKALKSICDDAV